MMEVLWLMAVKQKDSLEHFRRTLFLFLFGSEPQIKILVDSCDHGLQERHDNTGNRASIPTIDNYKTDTLQHSFKVFFH